MTTATPHDRKDKPKGSNPGARRSSEAPKSKQPVVDLEEMFPDAAKQADFDRRFPVIHVQETMLPAPLTMREASQMGVSIMESNSAIARQITSSARAADLDELGKGLTGLLVASREYDPSKWNRWSIVRFFRKKAAVAQSRIQTVDQTVANVLTECDRQVRLMDGRILNLEALYQENATLYNKLGEEIAKGEARIAESEANPPALDESDAHSVQEQANWQSALLFARKRVDDLKRSRAMSLLQGPQIQAMAENCYNVIQSFGTLKDTTIPTLQRQYASYVVQSETKKAVEFGAAVREETNRAMISNAKSLHANTVASNEAMSVSLVSIETLQLVHQELIDGIKDVSRIRNEMVGRLKADAPRIEAMNKQISTSLLLTHQQ